MKAPVHLNALRAFEASARHQSFSAAAAEHNNVSANAIGVMTVDLKDMRFSATMAEGPASLADAFRQDNVPLGMAGQT